MFGTAQKLEYDKEDRDSIFDKIGCQKGERLSNIIKALGWGNSKRIRNGGFRIAHSLADPAIDHPDYDAIANLKHNVVKDPSLKFEHGRTYISPQKGRTIAVVIIN